MFSPPAPTALSSATARTSRRRPRPVSSESSTSQPKAKRQRSALTDQTFVPLDGAPEVDEIKPSKSPGRTIAKRETTRLAQTPRRELAMRVKKFKSGERVTKGDGSVILTSNDAYTVYKLPAWPDRLQTDTADHQQGAVYSDFGYALSLSHTNALVWPYAINTPSPETFTFTLPHPSKHTSDPLPVGSLVSPSSSSSEPGLVVVMPSGKVTYWESIASAATLDLIQQQRYGVEHSISGLMTHEIVTKILNAESAGFVLGFSTGRIAYLSVRDGQGRPAISSEFLREAGGPIHKRGIFGSLRNVLSTAGWRGKLAAIKAGPANNPGERTVVAATSKGRLQVWNLHRGGHNALLAEVETSEPIMQALKDTDPALSEVHSESFELYDVIFTPQPSKAHQVGNSDSDGVDCGSTLLLLISIRGHEQTYYALVQLTLRPDSCDIGFIRHLRSYRSAVNDVAISRPSLHLPAPAIVAFVIFDRAVVVASIARQFPSPDAQLLSDSHIQNENFEDVVDFRNDAGVKIVGSGMEEPHSLYYAIEDVKARRHKAKYPSVLLLVKGGGLIRIAATDSYRLTSNAPQKVTAKSKLEQAVFFGSQGNNLLSFDGRTELQFSTKDVGEAALELSHDIITSTTPHIPSLPASIEHNLRRRASALHDLAFHLKTIGVPLDRVTRWKLMWDAEKIAGATVVWDRYNALLQSKPVGMKHGLLNDLVLYIHERYKTQPLPEAGELDRIRHWFINDIYRLQIAVPWAFQVVKRNYQEGQKNHAMIMSLVSEADDFVSGALGGAFSFRERSLGLYGLQDEQLENGILVSDYEGLPEFWTSTHFIVENVKRQTDLARALASEYWQASYLEGAPDPQLVNKVRKENVELVDLCCRSTRERYRWLMSQDDEKARNSGVHLRNASIRVREIHLEKLAELDLVDEAIELAEMHRVFSSLVKLVVEELERLQQIYDNPAAEVAIDDSQAAEVQQRVAHMQDLIQDYVESYGPDFANALYTYYVNRGELYALISDTQGKDGFLSAFLRSHGEFARVSWINEVTRENDYDRATKALLDLGLTQEKDVWSKRVELSIAKLAHMAGMQHSEPGGLFIPDGRELELKHAKRQLALLQIQEKVYSHIYPAIRAAIDDKAELQLALEVYGNKGKITDTMFTILTEKLSLLIGHKAMNPLDIVDLLTLMGGSCRMEQPGFLDGQEFYYALLALKSGSDDAAEFEEAEKLVWRRCMLRDDWCEINNTNTKDDRQVQHRLRRTAIYVTLKTCIKNRLFEKFSGYRVISPQEALGAYTANLDIRFSKRDASLKDSIVGDMKRESETLEVYIETCRLGKWFEGALDLARQSLAREANEEVENGIAMQQAAHALHTMEEQITTRSRDTALSLLRSKPRFRPRPHPSGSIGVFGGSVRTK